MREIIVINQNWNGKEVLETQKTVPDKLSWNWQYTDDSEDELKETKAIENDRRVIVFKNGQIKTTRAIEE